MGYQEIFRESNETVKERYALVMERIAKIGAEETTAEPYRDYFRSAAKLLLLAEEILKKEETGELWSRTLQECEETNDRLYADVLPENYGKSYANPTAATAALGETFGGVLCFLYAELRSAFLYAFEGRKLWVTIFCELFVEIYNCFEAEEEPEKREIEQIIYWFFHDYSEIFSEDKVRGLVDPECDFFTKIVMESDLSDLRYLYRYGEHIGENELAVARFLNTMDEEEICAMAETMTQGFWTGFKNLWKERTPTGSLYAMRQYQGNPTGSLYAMRQYQGKETVCIEYPIGFERVVRASIKSFARMGFRTTIYRTPASSFFGGGKKRGVYASPVNPQYTFDHKSDSAFYLDKSYAARVLETMRLAFETYQEKARRHAGPAVIETFGEVLFAPCFKAEAPKYSKEQEELLVLQAGRLGELTDEYIPGDERSFTIIAYPIPEIGERFEEIFRETVQINTLDSKHYSDMQQKLIDILDQAQTVHITGRGENKTDLWVRIRSLAHPETETAFENCVADVNIPVGEVFTSPVLEGTNGTLHVTQVYLNGLSYQNLEIEFWNGKTGHYTCTNFEKEEENQKYLHENLMKQHKTLPMGEFAIGTNTTAYRMARDYGIEEKLPILIAEKTGPHFALGDTCYAHAEEIKVYNPDGKEVVAKENELSALRGEDASKAYVNCHTDITIPYDELGAITVIKKDGTAVDIIRDGKFTVEGMESLNLPLKGV